MQKESRKSRKDPPRVYDRASGEYRPVSAERGTGDFPQDFSGIARQRAERRRRHRRHVLLFFYFFLFVLVLSAAAVLSLTVLFKITDIRVTGSSRYSQQQIVSASGIKKGDNLFLTRTNSSAANIQKKLPYLGVVQVTRKLPASIEIHVCEDSIYGAVAFGNKYAILGENGRVLEISSHSAENCTVLKGISAKQAQVGKTIVFQDSANGTLLTNVMDALKKSGLKTITSVDFSKPYRIVVLYDNRVSINLGMPTDLDYKLRFAKVLLTSNIKSTEKGTLNMSVVADTDKAYFDPDYSVSSSSAAGK